MTKFEFPREGAGGWRITEESQQSFFAVRNCYKN